MSLADQLVLFMRVRDEASARIEEIPREGDLWPQLSMLMEQQERAISDALHQAFITVDRLGRMAVAVQQKKKA